jgi:ribosomal protein L39E
MARHKSLQKKILLCSLSRSGRGAPLQFVAKSKKFSIRFHHKETRWRRTKLGKKYERVMRND